MFNLVTTYLPYKLALEHTYMYGGRGFANSAMAEYQVAFYPALGRTATPGPALTMAALYMWPQHHWHSFPCFTGLLLIYPYPLPACRRGVSVVNTLQWQNATLPNPAT